jgi:hypothetical protein
MKKQSKAVDVVPDTTTHESQFSGKVYFVRKLSYLLSQAYEATIENGVIVKEIPISVEDMPATTIGVASKALWKQLRGE